MHFALIHLLVPIWQDSRAIGRNAPWRAPARLWNWTLLPTP